MLLQRVGAPSFFLLYSTPLYKCTIVFYTLIYQWVLFFHVSLCCFCLVREKQTLGGTGKAAKHQGCFSVWNPDSRQLWPPLCAVSLPRSLGSATASTAHSHRNFHGIPLLLLAEGIASHNLIPPLCGPSFTVGCRAVGQHPGLFSPLFHYCFLSLLPPSYL